LACRSRTDSPVEKRSVATMDCRCFTWVGLSELNFKKVSLYAVCSNTGSYAFYNLNKSRLQSVTYIGKNIKIKNEPYSVQALHRTKQFNNIRNRHKC
jgi:hypothetical protein